MKSFFVNLLLVLSISLFIAGIGLLIWTVVGQYMAQIAYDGQYIKFRIINDVSLWGLTGIGAIALGLTLFVIWNYDN